MTETVKPPAIMMKSRRYEHANIHKALEYAVKLDLIPYNVSDRVTLPKVEKYTPNYMKHDEMVEFLEATKDHKLSLLFQMALFYGMRKSEIIGLKWDAIDFENDCFTVRHTVTDTQIDGKSTLVCEDKTKTSSSYRTLPLIPDIKEKLLFTLEKQKENKVICGNCYVYDYDGYVFVDPMGMLYRPSFVYESFKRVIKENGFKDIRFHDTRHSCASLMVAEGEQMKNIQEWLGHSDIGTTANIYSHLDYKSKVSSAERMAKNLALPDNEKKGDWE